MEEQFQFHPLSLPAGGEAPTASFDEAYYSGVCAGLSFRSLLSSGPLESAAEFPQNLLKMPKAEPLFAIDDGASSVAPPYNFFSKSTSSSIHHQLPSLLSYEPPQNTVAVESPMINPRSGTASNGKQPRRRQASRLSEKTRCLEKLLPSGKKKDMATVLEEAHKYIRFLQAQISVLQSMPRESGAVNYGGTTSVGGGDLERLNRQQLLQVVMNSPVAQTQFYSKGCCVYSVEQLLLLKKNAEMEGARHHMMLGATNRNSFHP